MKQKPQIRRPPKLGGLAQGSRRTWHDDGEIEIILYVKSLRKAARDLAGNLDVQPTPDKAGDACPVILLYKQAVELDLKEFVGEGSNFLATQIDPITLAKTHSLRWLAQLAVQIVKAVRWESEFKCEGCDSIAAFSALVGELEALDPVPCLIRRGGRDGSVPVELQPLHVLQFAKKLDAMLDLLEATTDALVATWGQMMDEEDEVRAGGECPSTVH